MRILPLLSFLGVVAFAQPGMRTVTGVVADPSGATLGGATVIALDSRQTELSRTTTAEDGRFELSVPAAAGLRLRVSKPRFKTADSLRSRADA